MPRGAKKQLSPIELAQMGLLPHDWDRPWELPKEPGAVSPTPDEVLGTKKDPKNDEDASPDDDKTR